MTFEDLVSGGLRDIVTKQEEWLQDICRQTGMTPEQLGGLYYIEQEPIVTSLDPDGVTFRATQNVRLTRRPADKENPA